VISFQRVVEPEKNLTTPIGKQEFGKFAKTTDEKKSRYLPVIQAWIIFCGVPPDVMAVK
jgi:hypothetical protein